MIKKLCLVSLCFLFFPLLSVQPAFATWPVEVDTPSCSISPWSGASFLIDTINPIVVQGFDASGIFSITLNINASTVGTSSTNPFTYNWNTTGVTPGPYIASALIIDGVGNPSNLTTCPSVNYTLNPAGSAWVQTTGDVHSNTNIKTPGGP